MLKLKNILFEACWDGYRQVGMKKKGDRNVPNCVSIKETEEPVDEDLRAWFGKGGKGGVGGGGWDRYNGQGDRIGKCGDADKGDAYSSCLSKDKAAKLGKKGRAAFVRRKRAAQKKGGDAKKGGEQSKGQKAIKVKTEVSEANRIPRKSGQHANSSNHSDLFTDENPKGTIHGLKFATVDDAKKSINKIKGSGRSHAHKMQAAVAMEQRAKSMGKTSAAQVYRSFINSQKKNETIHAEVTEAIIGNRIACDNCDHSWPIADGGDKPYLCHGCGHDNTPIETFNEIDYHSKLSRGHKPDWYQLHSSDFKPFDENFADGKTSGRKGLSKRFGISQKMSITQLEKIAKSATGERRRMAQWNLNMKRGRKNENLDPETYKDTGKSSPYGSGYSKVKTEELLERLSVLLEKNVPNDPGKWSYYKGQAKKKFDVYPSAYANGWAAKMYKKAGGTWKKEK